MQDAMRKGRIGWTPKVVVPKTVLGTNISEGILRSSRRPVGEVNHKAKLTNELVLEIRRMWATGNYTKNALALAFGVKAPAIYKIVERRTWKHI